MHSLKTILVLALAVLGFVAAAPTPADNTNPNISFGGSCPCGPGNRAGWHTLLLNLTFSFTVYREIGSNKTYNLAHVMLKEIKRYPLGPFGVYCS